jgi:hypothetical protein
MELHLEYGMKIALLTAMLKGFLKGAFYPSKLFTKIRKVIGDWLRSARAFIVGLASLVFVSCAGSIPGLHADFSYDGKSAPTGQTAAFVTQPVNGYAGGNLVTDLTQK